ncbi:hypothetical protein J2R70_000103 [Bradyrhizobium japonicum]|nr:hypothetical protein [Bradyrhizobium japonicum]
MPAAERRIAFEVLAEFARTVQHFADRAADELGSLEHVEVDPRDLRFAHAIQPRKAGAEPLRMLDPDMHRRPLERNARLLEADAHLGKDVVDEALGARAVGQPVDDAVG